MYVGFYICKKTKCVFNVLFLLPSYCTFVLWLHFASNKSNGDYNLLHQLLVTSTRTMLIKALNKQIHCKQDSSWYFIWIEEKLTMIKTNLRIILTSFYVIFLTADAQEVLQEWARGEAAFRDLPWQQAQDRQAQPALPERRCPIFRGRQQVCWSVAPRVCRAHERIQQDHWQQVNIRLIEFIFYFGSFCWFSSGWRSSGKATAIDKK